MGLPTSIDALLDGGIVENARIEFKASWDPQTSLKTICAFANDIDNWGGGYLVIGVTDNGEGGRAAVGVPPEKIDGYLKDMLNKCKLIQPSYMPLVDVVDYQGTKLIVLWAPGGSTRPYSSPKTMGRPSERIYWIRKMASTIAPTEDDKRDLYSLANQVPFDDRINHGAEVSDLNLTLIKEYLREVGSSLYAEADTLDFTELCRAMGIVEGPAEFTKPKNVGLLFFSMNPEKFFPYARIDIVDLPDGEGGDRLEEHIFRGPIHQQMREAMLYLQNRVIEEHVIKRPDAAEADRYFNYPYAALEEALANAVYHKGYDVREPIEVRILPDRIEFLSFPGADRSISIEGLKQFRAVSRRYRNRRVGDFLKELHLTEGRNTGMRKMLNALRRNGSPDPVFETDEGRLYFLVTIYAHRSAEAEGGEDSLGSPTRPVEETGPGAERATAKKPQSQIVFGGVAQRQDELLDFFAQHPAATVAQAAKALGVGKSTINRDIESLKVEGRLRRHGSAKAGTWVVL
ncbi:RNA-binding domain-containing protein [uncultured Adlercreutzia sp.]|uniref:RNA-binding domain-containing protein n=1 Tax=uncultured Adlercreutzia sp. TaxID=875803 RepID=UPI0025E93441|nr:RNA-binding domain-containing protein [uncultured Adlercreutzia sp.]